MSEPTLALKFEDFILRVAEHLGVASYASGTAAVPTDAHDLEVCKRVVNDGYRRFFNSNPRWNWTNRAFTITFDSDAAGDAVVNSEAWRYYMPDGFYGHLLGPITYAENTGHLELVEHPEAKIRAMRQYSETTGYPYYYAVRPLAGDDKRRWELIVYPTPESDLVVTGRCRIFPNKLTELTDTPNCGPQFDEALLAACLAEAERQKEDASTIQEAHWAEALTRAIAIDQQSAPTRLGDYGGGSDRPGRAYTGVDTYTNLDGTVHTFE